MSGATLHEIGHVLAAAAPAGSEALNIAIVVKLIRVALLVGVAIVVGIWAKRTESGQAERQSWKSIPIPWFIFGFLAMSTINSIGIIPNSVASRIVFLAYLLIA
ncbi:putative sulfate exporter family transporter, partial [Microbacteriaceae bacterium K1510]|nr:putative sulfate exporter family transporter [Microbacteriaceae bacterium K1510]